jgi:hypothetical protein
MRRHDIPLALAGLDKLGDAVARLDQESAIGDEIGFVTSCGGRRVMSALPASLHDNTRTAQAARSSPVLIVIVASSLSRTSRFIHRTA